MQIRLRAGFTIVELLIVVVVIAILASITVVAYSGVTQKADNTQTLSLVREWKDTLEMYKVQIGEYPKGNLDYVCLGKAADYPAAGSFDANQCMKASTWGVTTDDTMLTAIQEQTGGIPSGHYINVRTLSDGNYRGLLYLSRNNGYGITYVLNKTADGCLIGDTYFEQSGYLVCRHVLSGDPYAGL